VDANVTPKGKNGYATDRNNCRTQIQKPDPEIQNPKPQTPDRKTLALALKMVYPLTP